MVAIDFFLQDFEIDRIKKFTAENERILIQLPNHLLKFSVPMIKALPNAVLSEHKCCLEQLNHSNHECIVHFGQSCLSNSVQKYLLIFEKLDLDVKKLKESIDGFDKVLLLCDVDYYHTLIDIKMDNVICCQIKTDSEMQIITDHCIQGYYFNYRGNFADLTVVYIGRESLCMTNIAMSFATSAFYSFDPVNNKLQKRNESMLLNRRFFLVQKVKVANVIGIVVGTTNSQYLSILANLKKLITAAGKKYYLLAVGQPSPQKLGNFPEIEAFVLISCPQNALLDSREFMNPVITPYELKIALDPRAKWDLSEYELDVLKMNTEIEDSIHNLQAIDSDEEPEFSLITGGFVTRKYTREKDFQPTDDALVKKSDATVSNITHTFASAAFLSKREFKGLEVQKGETEVTEIEQGRAGIARGYVNEVYEKFENE